MYAPPEGVPTDFTQDFFVFLERRLGGDAGFYAEVFESLEDESPSAPIEPSVDALDEVLAARGDGLRTAWRDWVRDFVFDAPSDYGMTPAPFNSGAVRGQREETVVLPPLSYQVHDYRTSTSTLQVTARIDGPSHVLIQILVRGYADGPVEELAVNAPGEDFTLELTDLPDDALPRIAFANPYLGTADEVTVHLTLSDGVETLYEVLERICPPTLALSTGTYYPYSTGLVGGGYDGRCLECQAAQCNYATETDHVVLQATRRPPQWSESSCHPMAGFDPITYIVRHGDGVYATVATSRRTGATRPLDVELQGVVDMLHARLVGEGAGACTGPLAYETDFSLAPGAALHGSEEASVTFEYFGAPTYPLTVSWPVDGNCNGHLDCTPRTRTLDLRDTELVQSDPLGELRRFVIAGLTRCTASDPDPEPTYHIAWGVRDAEGRQIGGSVLAFRCEPRCPDTPRSVTLMRRASISCDGPEILPAHLSLDASPPPKGRGPRPARSPARRGARDALVLRYVTAVLNRHEGNRDAAAAALGISVRSPSTATSREPFASPLAPFASSKQRKPGVTVCRG
ncbi:MAG: hypothetical protein M5U28_43420 [Sandaracinaceae bacterium]|nr:hypothetical protein [Sandaracinaceae bacterium]